MNNQPFNPAPTALKTLVAIVAIFAVAGVAFITIVGWSHVSEQTSCVVESKDRTRDQNGESDARIYTENCGTFQVKDDMLRGHFSSADTYGKLDEGATYDFRTTGYRVPFLSMFPNIIEAEETAPAE